MSDAISDAGIQHSSSFAMGLSYDCRWKITIFSSVISSTALDVAALGPRDRVDHGVVIGIAHLDLVRLVDPLPRHVHLHRPTSCCRTHGV
jgi:hypothetical protein